MTDQDWITHIEEKRRFHKLEIEDLTVTIDLVHLHHHMVNTGWVRADKAKVNLHRNG